MAEGGPPAKKLRFTGDLVKVAVGQGEVQTFTTHEQILRKSSPFFNAALDKQWKEAKERKIELPEDNPIVVDAYLGWCYSEELETANGKPRKSLSHSESVEEHIFLARCYIFGEKIQANEFCNHTISCILELTDQKRDKFRTFPGSEAIRIIYNGTPETSKAHAMMVYLYSKANKKAFLDGSIEDKRAHCYEFVHDLAVKLLGDFRSHGEERLFDMRHTQFK